MQVLRFRSRRLERIITNGKITEAEKVYVTHGSTEIFSKYLNEIGIAAEVVKTKFGEEEQGDDNIEPEIKKKTQIQNCKHETIFTIFYVRNV